LRIFDATVFRAALGTRIGLPGLDAVLAGFRKRHGTGSFQAPERRDANPAPDHSIGAATYALSPAAIRTFATSGLPFLTFYEFTDLAGWYRDTYFAPDHVEGYARDIGVAYTVWTYETVSRYHRHLFLDDMPNDIAITFDIPTLDASSWFPLRIRLHDSAGLYFQHDQKLVVERLSAAGTALASWKKVAPLREALPRLHRRSAA
jgi:hypothetical protein